MNPVRKSLRSLPASVWALGFGSLFMDMSSELIHALLPLLMVDVLGASVLVVGIVEGVAEATAAITKLFSGALSDYLRRRKMLVVLGYGLAALTKPVFPLANSIGWIMAARFVDRVGKGIRGAPRDALVTDITPANMRGAAFGLRQSLDSVGAFLGPLLAILLLVVYSDAIQTAMWYAVIPAVITVTLLIVVVREPEHRTVGSRSRVDWHVVKALPARYWWVIALGAMFTLARFSEAFLILRAQDTGFALEYVPAVMIAMNVVYALGAYPAGILSDRMRNRDLLLAGLLVLVVADGLLALSHNVMMTLSGAVFWGVHMALTQGLFSKLVADTAPEQLRGTAFGVFNLVSGVALLLASVVAGGLWNSWGPQATFLAGAAFALFCALGLLFQKAT